MKAFVALLIILGLGLHLAFVTDVAASAWDPKSSEAAHEDDPSASSTTRPATVRAAAFRGYDLSSQPSRAHTASEGSIVAPKAGGGADDVLGAGARALPRGTPELTQQRLEHIVGRHWASSGASNAGKFAPGTSGRDLRGLIDETARSGAVRPNTGGRSGQIFEQSFGRQIGTSSSGQASSQLRVVVGADGKVVTAFPY